MPGSRCLLLISLSLLAGCTCGVPTPPDGGGGAGGGGEGGGAGGGTGGGIASGRCETDLSTFLATTAGSSRARRIASDSDLIGGPTAQGRVGDFLLENEKVRAVIQGDGRVFGAQPYGATILDADLVRADGGQDQFGEIGLLYNFGRTVKPTLFEVLSDGSDGGSAIIAMSGDDAQNDYLSIRNKLAESLGRVPLVDPYQPVPLRITNYFVLNPNDQRVRFVTAFCNTSALEVSLAVGDLTDPGYVLEFFNPRSCTNGFGYGGFCFGLDRMTWYGYQGDGVAYGYAPYRAGSPTVPEAQNATLTVAGITGSIVGVDGLTGLIAWINPSSTPRDGEIRLPPHGNGVFARDFWIAKDLGEIGTLVETSRSAATGNPLGTVNGLVRSGGQPLANAKVVLEGSVGRAVFLTGADGRFTAKLAPQTWQASAWASGRLPSAKQQVDLVASTPSSVTIDLVDPHRLTVSVREANGGPMPAKVTVLCQNGPCAVPNRVLGLYTDVPKDPQPDNVRMVGRIGASGTATFDLPPDRYDVLVSRGPEYSVHPNTYPAVPGETVDLRTADATINAVLAHVVDTTGWMSADFHVHAVNSPDSIVDNSTRALSFSAHGVDIIVSTDHDFVTDYAPVISRLGLTPFLASVVGEEASPMEFGHYNFFPMQRDATSLNGGAMDWAGPDGPTLTVRDLFAEARRKGIRTIHYNHPRGSLGGFTYLKVDTDTLATHIDPVLLGMSVQPDATANDTRLMSADFNAMEVLNPGVDDLDGTGNEAHGHFNDWFTLLSRGVLIAGTGVSDTHYAALATGWRTWVEVGVDSPAQMDPLVLSDRLNAMRAITSNAPFVKIKAYRVDASGAMVTAPVGIGGTVGPDPRDLGVQVEVQVPQYLDVTKVELYLHVPGDDASCPVDPLGVNARTTRVACDGVMTTSWPAASIAATQTVALSSADLEVAATEGATQFKRYRKTLTFRLPAPVTDNWLVAMVYGSKTLAPLLYGYPGLTGSVPATAPFAFTNPILIDADGNGYDKPPFRPQHKRSAVRRAQMATPSLEPAAIQKRWGEAFGAH